MSDKTPIELMKAVRKEYGLSQADLAEVLEFQSGGQGLVSNMENGVAPISKRTFKMLKYIWKYGII